jgi:hypothetical protein
MRRVIAFSVLAAAVVALATAAIAQRVGDARVYGPERPVYGENRHYLPGRDPVVRWEYATLSFHIVRDTWAWKTATERIHGNKSQILRALGGHPRNNDVSYVDISAQVGGDGWEICSVLERDTGTEVWFKRPCR